MTLQVQSVCGQYNHYVDNTIIMWTIQSACGQYNHYVDNTIRMWTIQSACGQYNQHVDIMWTNLQSVCGQYNQYVAGNQYEEIVSWSTWCDKSSGICRGAFTSLK